MLAARIAALSLAFAAPLAAQESVPCAEHWGGRLENLSHPLAETTRSFANGEVHVLILAAPDPACCGVFVAVILPEAEGYPVCRLLTGPADSGWGGATFLGEAAYDPARGLLVPMELSTWDGEAYDRTQVQVNVNRATGRVAVVP